MLSLFERAVRNPLLLTDSYKVSHWRQYPPGTRSIYSYWESRGGEHPEVTFFGLQALLRRYLSRPVTHDDVMQARDIYGPHVGPDIFNEDGWMRLLEKHEGRLPVSIRAVPEGMVVPVRNVMLTIENTDPEFYWLTNYLETILSQLWYPSTVCTISRAFRQLIARYLHETGDLAGLMFMLHDFGFRGVSSVESAAIGGAAHLVNFRGTDTVVAIPFLLDYYAALADVGLSIPAAEHSTITSWLRENEGLAFQNMVTQYGSCKAGLYAVVSDSYNIFEACEMWGTRLKDVVMAAPNTLVVRPDSGTPHVIVVQVIETLDRYFGHQVNEKGFKILNKVRVIQGDGVDLEEGERILEALKVRGWSANNIAFGMGGALLQKMDRDTQKFAIKCSWADVGGQQRMIYKDPITDHAKRSKKGRLKLVLRDGVPETVSETEVGADLLRPVYRDGQILREDDFETIRRRAAAGHEAWTWKQTA